MDAPQITPPQSRLVGREHQRPQIPALGQEQARGYELGNLLECPRLGLWQQIPIATVVHEAKPKSRALYAVLAVCLGWIGVHNFYAGRVVHGLAQLGISFGLAFLVFPVGLVWLWAIIEIGAVKNDGHGVPMTFLPRR